MMLKYSFSSLDLRLAILVFILTSSIYLIFMDGNTTSDGYFYFLCAQSVISDHDLSIEPELPYGNPVDNRAPQGVDGKRYLYNHLGWVILLLPLTAIGTFMANFFSYNTVSMFIASTTNCFITAFTCVILYLFSRKLKYSPRTSILLSLFYGFTTMAFPYATNSFCEPANTLMILLSLFWLYSFCQDRAYPMLALSGLAMGYACFIRIWDLFLLPGLFLYIILYYFKKEERPFKLIPAFVVFLLPIFFMILLNEAYFYFTCGSGYFFGEGGRNPEGMRAFSYFKPFAILPRALYGLLFSTGKGIFFYNPVILFSLFSFRNFHSRHRFEAWIFAYVFISHLIFIGSLADRGWTGDLAWGPRYLLPAIPFLILLLAGKERKNRLWPRLLIVGALAGLIVQLPSILVDTDLYTIHALEEGRSHGEIYFIPRFSPIIGTWKVLGKEIASFSRNKSTGLSPWFFRLFDQEIHTHGADTIPISPTLAKLVWSAIFILIFILVWATCTIIRLL